MLTEKNFAKALRAMNFTQHGDRYEKIFAEGIVMSADLKSKKLFYPAQVKGRDRNNFFDRSHRENLVVFECVNRLLDKGYKPEDIELEKSWQLGHSPKGGRADICVSSDGQTLFIIECKTQGDEFDHELDNMRQDGGQLFSYWQQEQSCQWLVLYASTIDGKDELKLDAKCVSCNENIYRDAPTVPERFKIWSERYDKTFSDDVIFHNETVAYKIGIKPLRKRDLKDFEDTKIVNLFEEILRHNNVSDKENAFNRLIALFIAKLVDESRTADDAEVSFQFKQEIDTNETFQDRLQKLYADGMQKFMGEEIFYLPEDYPDKLFANFHDEENHKNQICDLRENFRKLKFYTNNAFAFVDVNNEKLFRLNAKVLIEVVDMLRNYRIIGSNNLQTLGKLFEKLLDKGFKQNEGQFFTPPPIAQFIWDSLPLDEIIARNNGDPPKIIDYACGAGHFLTEGFKAVNDCFTRQNLTPPAMWEHDKLFGVEKDYRLARVSKISLFMHGANEGKIKFGEGLEDYPDENISRNTFDILVANPPYSVKKFKTHLKLSNEDFSVLDKISNSGSEIETLFAERISQLVKSRGVAAVILASSVLSKEAKSFIAARESLLKNFYIRAVVELGDKTFSATTTSTVILFLEHFDEPPRFIADYMDVAETILNNLPLVRQFNRDIFDAYLDKIGVSEDDYRKFLTHSEDFISVPYFATYAAKFPADRKFYDRVADVEREKILYFGLTYRQRTLIIAAPKDVKEQESFLGYEWSNARGKEGILQKKHGGLLFDNGNRVADNTLAAVIRAVYRGEQLQIPALEKYFHYATLADMLDFDAADFTKKITLSAADYAPAEYTGSFPTGRLGKYITQIRGVSYKPNDLRLELDDNSLLLLRANNIGDGKINHDKVQFVSREKVSDAQIIRKGDILMCGSSGSLEHVGKVALCNESVAGETFGAFCKVIRAEDSLIPEYIAIYLSSPDCRKIIENQAIGSNIKNLKNEHIDNLIIPLPPVDVQFKIVDEFNAVDAQIAAQDDTIQQLDADIQAKFTALFEGKNFETRTVNELFDLQIGKTPSRDNYGYWSNGIHKWISVGDLGKYDRLTGDTAEKISQSAVNETGIKLVPANTVIMSFKLTIGRTAITSEEIYTNEAIAAFICKVKYLVNADYLRIYLQRHDWSYGQMQAVKGLTLNKQSIGRATIALPPLELQEEFAAYVTNCEASKKSARARREELIAARNELVTKYFR